MAKAPKKKKKAKSSSVSSSGGGGAQQFLVWHGEKIAVALVVLIALFIAFQGLGYLGSTPLAWQPEDLEKTAGEADAAIRASVRDAKEEGIVFFDHARFAEQIRRPIRVEPYRTSEHQWRPIIDPTQRTGAGSGTSFQSSDY